MNCLNCSTKVSVKAKYCSPKCRMAYTRRTKQGDLPEQVEHEQPKRTELNLSETDQMFEDYKPGYYTFVGDTRTSNCAICKKGFTTKLKLLRFCSPDCQKQIMVLLAQGLGK